jgi:hypothetical protein
MTPFEKFVEWLEKPSSKHEFISWSEVMYKARTLLAEEKAQKGLPCEGLPCGCDFIGDTICPSCGGRYDMDLKAREWELASVNNWIATNTVKPIAPETQMKSKLIEELREWSVKCGLAKEPEIEDLNKAYKSFCEILNRHEHDDESISLLGIPVIENKLLQKDKAYLMVQDKGLVKQMVEIQIPDKPQPLAVLADRKGQFTSDYKRGGIKTVELWSKQGPSMMFQGKDFMEAESKARAYLEGLPDKGKGE